MLLPAAAPDEFDPFRAERSGKDPDRRPPQQRVRDALQAGRVTHVQLHGSEELMPLAGARWSNASLTLVIGCVRNRSDGTAKGRDIDAAADGASGWLRALLIPAQEMRVHRFFFDGLPASGGANAFVEELDHRLMSLVPETIADSNIEEGSIPAAGLEDRIRCDATVYKLAIEEMRKTGRVRIGDNTVNIKRVYHGRARSE